jgi:hypothetical protein
VKTRFQARGEAEYKFFSTTVYNLTVVNDIIYFLAVHVEKLTLVPGIFVSLLNIVFRLHSFTNKLGGKIEARRFKKFKNFNPTVRN